MVTSATARLDSEGQFVQKSIDALLTLVSTVRRVKKSMVELAMFVSVQLVTRDRFVT